VLWKKTVVMLVVFAVLVVASVIVAALPEGPGGPSLDLPKITADDVTKIEVTTADGENYSLVKGGEGWTAMPIGKTTDEKRVERALAEVASLRIGNMVSKSSDSHPLYDVRDEGLTVAAYTSSGEAWRLIIGKRSSDERGDYVRKPGDDRVFINAGRLSSTFKNKVNYWRDRTVSKFDKESASALILEADGKSLSFIKGEGDKWGFETRPADLLADYRLDSDKVKRVAEGMANMSASDFEDKADSAAEHGLVPPDAKATVALKDGESVTLMVGHENDKNYYAKKEGNEQIFLISKFQRDKLRKTVEELRDLHVAAFDLELAERIEISKPDEKIVFAKAGEKWTLKEYSGELPKDFVLDPNNVESLARSASRLEGASLIGTQAPAGSGLNKPKGVLSVTLTDGVVKSIKVGEAADDKEIYVSGDEGFVFTVGKFNEKRLLKKIDELKVAKSKSQTPRISPDAMKNLPPGVAEQFMKQQREKIMQQQMLKQMMKKAKKEEKQK